MKKSQILAALALAFALGVAVIPSASTYAYVYQNDKNGAEEIINDSQLIDDLKSNIAEGKKHRSAAEYADYEGLYELINGDTAVTATVPAGALSTNTAGDITTSLNDVKDAQKAAIIAAFPASFDTSKLSDSTYENIVGEANTQLKRLADTTGTATTDYRNLKDAVNDAAAYVMYAEKATIANIQTTLTSDFEYKGNTNYMVTAYTTEDASGDLESVNFAGAIAYAKNQTKDYPYYNNLIGAVQKAEDVIKTKANGGGKYTVAEAEGALATLKAAIEGKTVPGEGDGNQGEGTNKPDNKPDQNAPDTGILADAEGSASTTVAMVAGIATALTAAGAGVVAYRNARRSSRK